MKICSKCNIEKELTCYFKDNGKLDKLTSSCKECYKLYKIKNEKIQQLGNKTYYQNNKEKIKLNSKEYYCENKNEHSLRMEKWKNNNLEYIKEYHNRQEVKKRKNYLINKKYKSDPEFRLKNLLRGRLNEYLKKHKTNKSKSALILLGCTVFEFRNYIESQFKPEMNWQNHGIIWEIDHIIPCTYFNLLLLEEQQECFHYTNMQPLFKTTAIAESFGYSNEVGNRNKYNKNAL